MLLRQLLEVCPDDFINRPDKHGWFPLHILANNKDRFGVKPGMISVLCKANADVNVAKGKGMTPLMCAVSTAHIDAADVLLLHGADINQANDEGTTAYDMTWHNRPARDWCAEMGSGAGAGVSGSGRFISVICWCRKRLLNLKVCKAF